MTNAEKTKLTKTVTTEKTEQSRVKRFYTKITEQAAEPSMY